MTGEIGCTDTESGMNYIGGQGRDVTGDYCLEWRPLKRYTYKT